MQDILLYYAIGSVAVGLMILFYYLTNFLFGEPDDKYGYAVKSPVAWIFLVTMTIPVINLFIVGMFIFFTLQYYFGFNRINNTANEHKDKVIVPMYSPVKTWHTAMKINRCIGCHTLPSDVFDERNVIDPVFTDLIKLNHTLKCPLCIMSATSDTPHGLIDAWNELNPISESIKRHEQRMGKFNTLVFNLKMSFMRKEKKLNEVVIFSKDDFYKKL